MKRIIFFVFFGLGGFAVLVSLGTWQIQRLTWKHGIIAQIENRIVEAPVALPVTPDPVEDKYLSVNVEGVMMPEVLRVLVSQKTVGAGYRLVSPFRSDGRTIMVDRGFISVNEPLPEAPLLQVQTVVTGNLHWPQETDGYTPEPDVEKNIWFARDVSLMSAALNTDPILIVLSGTTAANDGIVPLPVDTSRIPNDHLQYAITWFLLAFIWTAMTAYFLLWSRRSKNET